MHRYRVLQIPSVFEQHHLLRACDVSAEEKFESLYTVDNLLGRGAFGSVFAGVRKKDGKMVALKFEAKGPRNKFITIPGETRSLPLEVALMEMVSRPPRCENVVEMLEWFEMSDKFVLVLERPVPCMNLEKYYEHNGYGLSEVISQTIMRQVVRAAKHCCDCGVFHRDIKPENILINPDTLEVKLIDFGCGDLMKDEVYTSFSGTPAYCPPEWIRNNEYLAVPATVWSLGVVLYEILSGNLPFYSEQEISVACVPLLSGLSEGEKIRNITFLPLEQNCNT
ncbi:serine/threonine-protein kinase pim-1-like [Hemibagrus wyckioides]|uniref:serine/threonine-protein kinase pim-1-like n=1 Tax=Hemibagrus wyckioides TaxID=337641 RepID=UPI00266C767B|nr:serine/threonine-protein kinase pim-1-like [Hemibagrus wyckioides]